MLLRGKSARLCAVASRRDLHPSGSQFFEKDRVYELLGDILPLTDHDLVLVISIVVVIALICATVILVRRRD
jgi:hypothetical protein